MSEFRHGRWRTFALTLALMPAILLSACSGRDEVLSEKVAAAEAAAERAERAQHAAESAAKAAGAKVNAASHSSEPDVIEDDSTEVENTDSDQYDNYSEPQVAAEAPPPAAPAPPAA